MPNNDPTGSGNWTGQLGTTSDAENSFAVEPSKAPQTAIEKLQAENTELKAKLHRAIALLMPFSKPLHHTMRESITNWTGCDLQAIREFLPEGVYGVWCRDPSLCFDKGYCPCDPTCAD